VTTYVAMLRAVNVGGRVIAMTELRAAFSAMGHTDARTYIQTGNVVFGASAPSAKLRSAIEEGLEARFGPGITVVLRSRAQLAAIIEHNPLLGGGRDPKRLHVTFLGSTPPSSRVAGLETDAFLPDEFRLEGREVYVHCPGGYGRTKINNSYFERALGVVATTRNWNTVTALAEMTN
jgi:uncharacterized protein (DUF1697 family)